MAKIGVLFATPKVKAFCHGRETEITRAGARSWHYYVVAFRSTNATEMLGDDAPLYFSSNVVGWAHVREKVSSLYKCQSVAMRTSSAPRGRVHKGVQIGGLATWRPENPSAQKAILYTRLELTISGDRPVASLRRWGTQNASCRRP